MHDRLRQLAVAQFEALDKNTRLVVIHPNYGQQHTVLGDLFDQIDAYVRFEGNDLSKEELHAQLEDALEQETKLPAKAIIALDECDRADADALDAFICDLVTHTSARYIIFGRQMPQNVIEDPTLRQKTSFIPHDEEAILWDYAQLADDEILLEVRALGEGHVLLNGKRIDNWDGVLPRSLFFYLVDRGMTTRNEIFENFWPNLNVREATNVFHVTKRKISEVLGIDLTTYFSGFYRLSPEIKLSYDVVAFKEIVQNSAVAQTDDEAEALLEKASKLYQGDFLATMDVDWAKNRQQELTLDYADALINLAEAYYNHGHLQNALGLYIRAAGLGQNDTKQVYRIMQIYREMNQYDRALQVYEDFATMTEEPDLRLQDLQREIRQESEQTVA
jgi:DNA-binding SARP family transcriptional activator